jgi:hypothetical protein
MMGISPSHEALYIESMLFNCLSAMSSIHEVADTVEAAESGTISLEDIDEDAFLNHLQNVVVQGAALSRYFFPVGKGHEARGIQLRAALAVTEASALWSRDLRNSIEHFDERLDDYLSEGPVGHIYPRYVGPALESDGVPRHLFRAYFIDRGIFSLLGKEYQIPPLVDEIGRIGRLLDTCARSGGRLPMA